MATKRTRTAAVAERSAIETAEEASAAPVVEVVEEAPAEQPAPEPAPEPREQTFPVTLVVTNNAYGGDSNYVVELTDAQIRRLLSNDETPRYIRLPRRYSAHVHGETRWLRMTNTVEVHVGGGWEPPTDWEWMSSGA